MKWCPTVGLTLIYLMSNEVEHLFMCLLAICISFLEKCLLMSFVHFLIGSFVFSLLTFKSLDTRPYQVCDLLIFTPFL